MPEQSLYAGAALRRIRRRENLTQAAMAARLAISPSYLNLIERNQRPLSARVMMQLVSQFDFDPRALEADESIGGIDGLVRRMADERFSDLAIDREELDEFLAASPRVASAFARLFDNAAPASADAADPLVESRKAIERWRNHFSELDDAAEQTADDLRLSRADIGVALTERLRERHQLSVRILPREIMPDLQRRLDLHARQVQLSEMLPPHARNFNLAVQLAELEARREVESIAAGADFSEDTARQLFQRHLYGYFAAALLMPYGRFLRACQQTNYDFPVLERRFNVSFEQLAHRLTTLGRVGERGLPFFMARLDEAGQFSKRFAGASNSPLVEPVGSCPLWNVHRAFARPGEWQAQQVSVEGAQPSDWFTVARSTSGAENARFVVVVGVEARLAGEMALARGLSLSGDTFQPIGLGCRACRRVHCTQRSLPPTGASLRFDRAGRTNTPFSFGNG
ncbi:helix-turn-helix domain-containing protein [Qipengyuania atrilutea]|uniref:DUF2083 domain-containing protein n=1 Tax=Qipengyuania atrilutea TaxID=2744473 RepID=A0A850GZ73_9SPHN|nr:short-chain fatty acyl-CoA regulator family protein [Actirhodobacter atriluteus]NVD43687.1 DUF2083 domain-containing protein [Actirhodobacter atriluteus]